jgi:hypothetical protein
MQTTMCGSTRCTEAEDSDMQKLLYNKEMLSQALETTLTSIDNLASAYGHDSRWVDASKLNSQVMEIRKNLS